MPKEITKIVFTKPLVNPVFKTDFNNQIIEHVARTAGISRGKSYTDNNLCIKNSQMALIERTMKKNHISVLYNSFFALDVTCSRIATHELRTHSVGVSFMQQSTRYCVSTGEVICILPPDLYDIGYLEFTRHKNMLCPSQPAFEMTDCLHKEYLYEENEHRFINKINSLMIYEKTQEKQEFARYNLPQFLAANIIISGNYEAFRNIIRKRIIPEAADEMRYLANQFKQELSYVGEFLTNDLPEYEN